jgi:ribonucleoside-diphosphate reductase alpha chain
MSSNRVAQGAVQIWAYCESIITNEITNFNISVAVTDEFMKAVELDEPYWLIDPSTGKNVATLEARDVFSRIVRNAWATGEPGLFFIDEANRYNPVPHLGDYEATNPCGEQPLLSYDVCNLGSLNVGAFVSAGGEVDWEEMKKAIHLSVRFLDNVIEANKYPLPQITELAQKIRRIGNGVMGVADYLIKRGIPYDSEEALVECEKLASFFLHENLNASEKLGAERGVFPEWKDSIWGPDASCAKSGGERIRPFRALRNCNVTTIAPTGTISMIAGCSSGIEPLFAVAFRRNQAGMDVVDVDPNFYRFLCGKLGPDEADKVVEEVLEKGGLDDLEMGESFKAIFRTSHDIGPEAHIYMQSVWQENIDSAISKTVNFPKESTIDDVYEGYMLAYNLKCKGVTVYRDGCRPGQVLYTGAPERPVEAREDRDRPVTLTGQTKRVESPLGGMYVTVNEDENGNPFEVFINVGKAGGTAHAHSEAIGRLISMALQKGISIGDVYKQLRGISSERAIGFGPNKVLSMPDAVGQVLQHWIAEHSRITIGDDVPIPCPDCGSECEISEGCRKCHSCGYSDCG